jgi:hypothetical protein
MEKKLGVMVLICHPNYSRKHKTVQVNLGKKWDPISKIARAKRVGGMAQAVEHLPSKHEAPSSNSSIPSPTAKKKSLRQRRIHHIAERTKRWTVDDLNGQSQISQNLLTTVRISDFTKDRCYKWKGNMNQKVTIWFMFIKILKYYIGIFKQTYWGVIDLPYNSPILR